MTGTVASAGATPDHDGAVGFIGLGVMGAAMARRLRDAGTPLRVWSRDPSHLAALAGTSVRAAPSAAALARECPVVLSCLLDDTVIEAVHGGREGTLAAARPGTVLVEHGTFSPRLARRLAAQAADHGCVFLDAPVTGGSAGAAAGTLAVMVGGAPDGLERVRPVLAGYARLVEHVGPPGSGVALKLVNQMLVAAHTVAAADAARMITALGIPTEVAERILTSGWAASAMLARNLAPSLRDEPLDEGADIHHLALALDLVDGIVAEVGIDAVLQPVVSQRFHLAIEQGLARTDLSGMIRAHPPSPRHEVREGHLAEAVGDNAAWCDVVCRTHGLEPSRSEPLWACAQRTPDGYPDAITLARGADPREVLRHIDAGSGCSVKDSYADLDLAPFGFEELFTASWIRREPDPDEPWPLLDDLGWERVDDEVTLALWARAQGRAHAFRPGLLGRPDIQIVGRRLDGEFVAGAIATSLSEVVGLSNVFCASGDAAASYHEATAAARACFPGRPLVGYESGDDLAHALACGFRAIGGLRVWLKPS